MSKHNRTEVIKVLRQQMDAETDPQKKLEYAKQLAKLLPRPRQARRPRKVEAAPPSTKKSSILDGVTGSADDNLSDGKKVALHIVQALERTRYAIGSPLWNAERDRLKGSLGERERLALEQYAAEGVI